MRWLVGIVVVLVLLLAVAVAAVAFAPATVLARWIESQPDSTLRFDDVRGTVWKGSAGQVWNGREALGRVDWTLSPRGALRRELWLDLAVDGAQGSGQGHLRRSGSRLQVTAARARLPASVLEPVLAPQGLQPHGTVQIEIDEMRLNGRLPEFVRGSMLWSEARVSGASHAHLGGLRLDVDTPADGRLAATVTDTGGPLGAQGRIEMDWLGYAVDVLLEPRNSEVAAAIAVYGFEDPNGRRILLEGRWLSPATRIPD